MGVGVGVGLGVGVDVTVGVGVGKNGKPAGGVQANEANRTATINVVRRERGMTAMIREPQPGVNEG